MGRWYWRNRTLCDVLEEMRKCNETRNYAALLSLIEEVQIIGNRMESGLTDIQDLSELSDKQAAARKELNALRKEIDAAKEELEALG